MVLSRGDHALLRWCLYYITWGKCWIALTGQIDVLYLDFSKAFDSVPHNLLLYKLNQYGINGSLLNWFSSYLMGRRQRVVIESSFSDWLPVVSGVPQGSILGPFLFLWDIDHLKPLSATMVLY